MRHRRAPRRADRRDVREGRDVCGHLRYAGTVRARGAKRAGLVYNRSHPAAESWRWSVGNWNRLSGMPLPQAMLRASLATWFSSVRDGSDGMRECQLMLYGQVRLGMIGCILFTCFDLSPATSFSKTAFTAPCRPNLAPASRTLVPSIIHRSRDFVHGALGETARRPPCR